MLHFKIKNYVAKHDQNKDEAGGIGLENVQRRLALLYPKKHTLTIDKSTEMFTAKLKLHLE